MKFKDYLTHTQPHTPGPRSQQETAESEHFASARRVSPLSPSVRQKPDGKEWMEWFWIRQNSVDREY